MNFSHVTTSKLTIALSVLVMVFVLQETIVAVTLVIMERNVVIMDALVLLIMKRRSVPEMVSARPSMYVNALQVIMVKIVNTLIVLALNIPILVFVHLMAIVIDQIPAHVRKHIMVNIVNILIAMVFHLAIALFVLVTDFAIQVIIVLVLKVIMERNVKFIIVMA